MKARLQPYATVRQAIDDLRYVTDSKSLSHLRTKHCPEFLAKINATPIGQNAGNYFEAFHRCDPDKPSPTVKANNGSVFVHYCENRLMTPRELARLQSFPDAHRFCGNKRDVLIQIGNAVPVQMSCAFAQVFKTLLCDVSPGKSRKLVSTLRPFRTAGEVLRRWDTAEQPLVNHVFHRHSPEVLAKIARTPAGQGPFGYRQTWIRLHADRPAPAVTGSHGGVFLHPWRDRCCSNKELAVLQDFPDEHLFFGTKSQIRLQIGNAIPVGMARALGEIVHQMLSETAGSGQC